MQTKTFMVPNIGCNGCVNNIKNELVSIPGIKRVDGVVDSKTITVDFDAPATWEQIVKSLTEIEYAPAEA